MEATGRFVSLVDGLDYAQGMRSIRTPFLVIAGSADVLAHPSAVRAGYECLGSSLKRFRLVGRQSGDPEDFGHGDLVIGNHAPGVVFREITDWLGEHDPVPISRSANSSESP